MNAILDWFAPAATIIAAMMTAANLGARITGWGFVVFLLASSAWTAIGLGSGQGSLVYANGFLIIVNAIGVWRWLGRQASYEAGAARATDRSEQAKTDTLFSFAALVGADLIDGKGNTIGGIVDIMGNGRTDDVAYVVVREGGIGGIGERLHAVAADRFDFAADKPVADFDAAYLAGLEPLEPDRWPTRLRPQKG
jgi:hypothetical protein